MKNPALFLARALLLLAGLYLMFFAGLLWGWHDPKVPYEYIGVIVISCIALWEGRKCLPP
jgi:hypothetical protein